MKTRRFARILIFSGVYGVPDQDREEKIRRRLSFSGLEGKREPDRREPAGWV
jgi:hypothetical protein